VSRCEAEIYGLTHCRNFRDPLPPVNVSSLSKIKRWQSVTAGIRSRWSPCAGTCSFARRSSWSNSDSLATTFGPATLHCFGWRCTSMSYKLMTAGGGKALNQHFKTSRRVCDSRLQKGFCYSHFAAPGHIRRGPLLAWKFDWHGLVEVYEVPLGSTVGALQPNWLEYYPSPGRYTARAAMVYMAPASHPLVHDRSSRPGQLRINIVRMDSGTFPIDRFWQGLLGGDNCLGL